MDGNPVITHIWNGSEIVAEVGGAVPTIQNTYVYGLDRIMTGEGEYFTYNSHGDTTGFDGDEYDYDAFGNQIDANAEASYNPFRYCGEYFDEETGFVYLRARYYDPSTQRFISEDPAFDGYNWYAYCGNNPVNRWDPSGMFGEEIALTILSNPILRKYFVWKRGVYALNLSELNVAAQMLDNSLSSFSVKNVSIYEDGDNVVTKGTDKINGGDVINALKNSSVIQKKNK